MMIQLNPPVPMQTPKGAAWAFMCIDYGPDFDLLWVCWIKDTGECWTFRNQEVRQPRNITYGTPKEPSAGSDKT